MVIWYSGQGVGLGTVMSRVRVPVMTAICKFTVVRVCFVDGRIAAACVLKHTAFAVPDRRACTVSCVWRMQYVKLQCIARYVPKYRRYSVRTADTVPRYIFGLKVPSTDGTFFWTNRYSVLLSYIGRTRGVTAPFLIKL